MSASACWSLDWLFCFIPCPPGSFSFQYMRRKQKMCPPPCRRKGGGSIVVHTRHSPSSFMSALRTMSCIDCHIRLKKVTALPPEKISLLVLLAEHQRVSCEHPAGGDCASDLHGAAGQTDGLVPGQPADEGFQFADLSGGTRRVYVRAENKVRLPGGETAVDDTLGLDALEQALAEKTSAATDFIFCVCGEELGFVGCLAIIVLESLVIFRCFQTARLAKLPGT